MLGGDKAFHDRLCWVLVVPLAALALWAVDLAFLGLEVVVEGDEPGSATWWVAPLMSLAGGFVSVRAGASVAPARKLHAALAVASLYGLATLASALSRWHRGTPGAWCMGFVLLGSLGAGLGCYSARNLKDDDAAEAQKAAS